MRPQEFLKFIENYVELLGISLLFKLSPVP
jgi:hypothetical protein